MKAIKNFFQIIGSFIILAGLYFVFLHLFKYVFIISFMFVVLQHTIKTKWSEALPTMNKYLYKSIINWDIYCNQEFYSLFNFVFLKKNSRQKFGKVGETISSNLGQNQLDRTLTIWGWILVYILWIIDIPNWRKGGHCIASIQKE